MHLDDPCMRKQPSVARNYFLACYAVSLVQGHTIKGTYIKHATVLKYMAQAYAVFDKRGVSYESSINYIEIVLKAVKDYESVPNRRRMITDSMMEWLLAKAAKSPEDSATRAVVDWIILGRYTGFRSSESFQTTQSSFSRIDNWPGRPSLAVTRSDVTFLDDSERRMANDESLCDKLVRYIGITWRHQKNKDHGQEIVFAGDKENPDYCAARAGLRISQRSKRLGMNDHEPMGVYRHTNGKTKYITDKMVTKLLRMAACGALGLRQNDPVVSQWSTHSIRVTAANLLHRQNLSNSYIMKRLRWKSDAFLCYLRNTIHAAEAHTKAINVQLSEKDKLRASYRQLELHERIAQRIHHAAAA